MAAALPQPKAPFLGPEGRVALPLVCGGPEEGISERTPAWCSRRGVALVRCFGEVLRSRAPRDAERPVGWPQNLQASRGQGPSLPRARTTRRTAKFLACCVRRAPGDRQAAHGRPGQQRPFRPLAASLASSCPISSPWPAAAGGGSGRMSRPSGRRPSSCDQCGSTAATEPRRGRPQVRWSTAMDGELGARGRAARATGRSAGCRGARRRGTYWHTHRHSTCASLPSCDAPEVSTVCLLR